jgi:fatty acid desaturase
VRLLTAYAALQLAILVFLAITAPLVFVGMVVMGLVIYGLFFLLVKWLGFSPEAGKKILNEGDARKDQK